MPGRPRDVRAPHDSAPATGELRAVRATVFDFTPRKPAQTKRKITFTWE
jgi:hypothetical protein